MNPDSKLAQKIAKPGKARVCYCLRMAFKVAEESGDRETAMAWWSEAIRAGYVVEAKTKMRLMQKLRLANERNR